MPDWLPHSVAQAVVFKPLRIAFLILVALAARYMLHRLIDRAVRRSIEHRPHSRFSALAAAGLHQERREQRILAVGSLGRSVVTVVLFLGTAIMVLAELGFSVTTILAGTSIVGVTIAFGLQSIVKDLMSGVFLLMEDQLGVGDYVDMEKASGVVEEVGLRVTQLRDPDGVVWYVRNGEVVRVGNFSQGGPGAPAPDATPAPRAEPG